MPVLVLVPVHDTIDKSEIFLTICCAVHCLQVKLKRSLCASYTSNKNFEIRRNVPTKGIHIYILDPNNRANNNKNYLLLERIFFLIFFFILYYFVSFSLLFVIVTSIISFYFTEHFMRNAETQFSPHYNVYVFISKLA